MYHFVTASKDATIYLQQPKQNTGLDEILEISKVYYGNLKDIAHTLIKFDTNALANSINDANTLSILSSFKSTSGLVVGKKMV